MTIKEWLSMARQKIEPLDAELILLHFMASDQDRSWLISHDDAAISDDILTQINTALDERAQGKPLAYITHKREFYGRDFYVKDTLIPRIETEDIIDIIRELKPVKLIDVGTGSGVIAITSKLEVPSCSVTAIDVDENALTTAKKNAASLKANISFLHNNLLENIAVDNEVTIVANLPYVDKDWDWLDKTSLDYEPEIALYAEDGGLKLIYGLIEQLGQNGKNLILEADPCQHEKIVDFAKDFGWSLHEIRNFIVFLERK